jgi:hypothetical protein
MPTYRSLRPALLVAAAMAAAVGVSVRRPNLQARTVADPAPMRADSGSRAVERDGATSTAVAQADDGMAPVEIDWRTLATLDVRSGRPSERLRQLDGRAVRLPGYVVPLDDFADAVTEFLLVPYFGACIHMPPPPPNQMVHVTVGGGAHRAVSWARPVWIEGRLAIRAVTSPYGVVAFQLRTERITPYTDR